LEIPPDDPPQWILMFFWYFDKSGRADPKGRTFVGESISSAAQRIWASRLWREAGMAEMFTVQRLKLPPSLYKCLGTTNVIESPQRYSEEN
jgi:hypothetical protein